jgi:uncharacterized protein involved in tolerance to divalent cations
MLTGKDLLNKVRELKNSNTPYPTRIFVKGGFTSYAEWLKKQ